MLVKIALTALIALVPAAAFADEVDQCAQNCTDGTVKTGFLDGHMGTCVCLPPGDPMQDVEGEASVGEESPNAESAES